jgi:hypothetical protein
MSVAAPQRGPGLGDLADKLDALIRRLSTDHEGERLATLAAIERLLAGRGLRFHDLADLVGDGIAHRELLQGDIGRVLFCLSHAALLTDWEIKFCRSLLRFSHLSPKQTALLDRLVRRVREGER